MILPFKKIKITGLILIIFFTTVTYAQSQRNISDFNGIHVGDIFNVVLIQSDTNTIKIDADEKTQPYIRTEIKDGILTILSDNSIKNDQPLLVTIHTKKLSSIIINGSADLKTENQLISDTITIESSGIGNVLLDLKTTKIITKVKGRGDVTLTGTTQTLDATVSGAGDLKASDLETDNAIVKVTSEGDAKVYVTKSIDADVSGAGSIIYKGTPAERTINISGLGSVRESKSGTGDETARDTTKFQFGKKKYIVIDENNDKAVSGKYDIKQYNEKFKHWTGIEIGINGILNYRNSTDAPAGEEFIELDYTKSLQFGLNLLEKDFHIYKNYLNLITGIGFDFNHYALKNNVTLNSEAYYLIASTDSVKYKKNMLNISYLKLPLMLEYNSSKNPENNWHIAVGCEFAYRIHSVTKQRYYENDEHFKIKKRDDFNLAPFRYSSTVRIGYNNVTVFANYGLNRLFKKDMGPQVYPFTFGINVNF
ncbi:MAG: DUF2807 domain-containing protein [Bacteroidota bacterium]